MSKHVDKLLLSNKVLLLQGPMGDFFYRLSKWLNSKNIECYKINFNGGDRFFYKSETNVYDYKGEYLCTFRSIMDIVTYSKSKFHKLPLLLRNPQKRNSRKQQEGINIYELGVTNIERVCKRKCKHHKGLIFRYENDIQDIEKLTPKDIQFKRHNYIR